MFTLLISSRNLPSNTKKHNHLHVSLSFHVLSDDINITKYQQNICSVYLLLPSINKAINTIRFPINHLHHGSMPINHIPHYHIRETSKSFTQNRKALLFQAQSTLQSYLFNRLHISNQKNALVFYIYIFWLTCAHNQNICVYFSIRISISTKPKYI